MKKFFALLTLMAVVFFASMDLALAKKGKGGNQIMPVEFYGQVSSTTTGAAALVFTVTGLKAGSECVVTPQALGTGPAYMKKAVVTLDTITVTFDANQTAGTTTINYVCFNP